MKRIAILGAGGHGKVAADIASLCGYSEIVFLDDNDAVKNCGPYPVIGKNAIANSLGCDLFVAIGNPMVRRNLMEKLESVVTLIHPNAVIAKNVTIGNGVIVMAGAVINPGTSIGEGVIINTCSSVDHDCEIGNYVHVAVGAHIAGSVRIEDSTWIGAGATISNNVNICENSVIGAGAVVVKDIWRPGVYIGIPAREKRKDMHTESISFGRS